MSTPVVAAGGGVAQDGPELDAERELVDARSVDGAAEGEERAARIVGGADAGATTPRRSGR